MAEEVLNGVLGHIRRLVEAEQTDGCTDGELLERFLLCRDETAFAALVRRHGPLVLGVCRRVLCHGQDAEDACQAAFLILARKGSAIRHRGSVGSWLHGVAYRVAARLRRDRARRQARETPIEDVAQPDPAEATWREVRTILDAELGRLPQKFRAPLLLCYLQGRTRDEAARELGWSEGTLRGRLERGRELLRARLARRGLTLSAALFASLLCGRTAPAAIPTLLELNLVRAATGAGGQVPARVAALAAGAWKTMWITKLNCMTALVLTISLLGFGVILGTNRAQSPPTLPAEEPQAAAPAAPALPAAPRQAPLPEQRRDRAQSQNNLKQLALAMHNYLDAYQHFPAPAYYGAVRGMGGNGGQFGMAGGGQLGMAGGGMAPMGRGMGFAGGGVGMGGGGAGGRGALRPAPALPSDEPAGTDNDTPRAVPPAKPLAGTPRPPVGGTVAPGRALLSWRVALLPFLGQQELFKQFHLHEPWDSPHNRRLLDRMPQVYAAPGGASVEPGMTYYQVFVGEHAAFEKHRALSIQDFTDGTSNTILIVEAGSPVPWTKPEDLHYAADEPLPRLGGLFPNVFHAAFVDGSVHTLSKHADPETLRHAITRDGGEVIDLDLLHGDSSNPRTALRQHNAQLRHELQQLRHELEELRAEMEALQEDGESTRLRQEQAELEKDLRQLRDETRRLREQIRRLRAGK